MKNGARLLDCLAASYRLDLDGAAYVQTLAAEAARVMDRGLGVLAYTYDARDPSNPSIDHVGTSVAFDPAWLPRFYEKLAALGEESDPSRPTGFTAWGNMTCGQASRVRGMRPYLPAFAQIGGAVDTFAVNARDASGRGLWLGAPMRSTARVPDDAKRLFARFAGHLTAAVRLRRTFGLDSPRPTAVMSTNGALVHAESDEAVGLRDELRRAALAFDLARTREARNDVNLATRRWRPLVQASWSLLDDFDTDGRRFIIAVDNAPPTRTPRGPLSERERQVLTQAQLGHSNKVIAYDLGLSNATVRVLLHRAARKLGATTRAEALARFTALGETADPD